jgi:hypothetical protein
MSAWLNRWAPASGALAAVLAAISIFAGPSTPGDNATGQQVITWYNSHHGGEFAKDIVGALAVLFLVLFAVALARQVRTGDRWLAHGALAGAVFGGVSLLTSLGFDSVLAQDHNHLTIASAQTLNLLQNDFFVPIVIGFALFGILTGLAVVVGRILPKWMGWVMFAFGILCLAGPIGFAGLLATLVWVLVASVWLVRQGPPVPDYATPRTTDEHGAAAPIPSQTRPSYERKIP